MVLACQEKKRSACTQESIRCENEWSETKGKTKKDLKMMCRWRYEKDEHQWGNSPRQENGRLIKRPTLWGKSDAKQWWWWFSNGPQLNYTAIKLPHNTSPYSPWEIKTRVISRFSIIINVIFISLSVPHWRLPNQCFPKILLFVTHYFTLQSVIHWRP